MFPHRRPPSSKFLLLLESKRLALIAHTSLRTDSVVNKLIMMSVNNGLLSSTIAFGAFICVVVWDAGFVTIALCSLLGKGECIGIWTQRSPAYLVQPVQGF